MKNCLTFLFLVAVCSVLPGQIISHFTWDNIADGPLKADFGPNAISADSDVYVSSGGAGGTNGLNPGTTTANVNLVLADNPIFDLNGIDISLDFQRNESMGTLLMRGFFILGTATDVTVTYRTEDGAGGFREVTSGPAASFVDDDTRNDDFGRIRFVYTPSTGLGELFFNGTRVWSDPTPVANRNLYWTGAGNIVLGDAIDASLANLVAFDNFLIQEVEGATLPVTLTEFTAEALPRRNKVRLQWETAREINSDHFVVERSGDSRQWTALATLPAAGNRRQAKTYQYLDRKPLAGTAFYRLRQVDLDGSRSYSDVVRVAFEASGGVSAFPNPVVDWVTVQDAAATKTLPRVVNGSGRRIRTTGSRIEGGYRLNTSGWAPGTYHIRSPSGTVTVVRQ